jgi:hypothetical protein
MKAPAKQTLLLGIVVVMALITMGCTDKVSLFDGKTLEGWGCDPPELTGHWSVVDGVLVGENSDEEASLLWTTRPYRNFEVELEYFTLSKDYDSGLFLRAISHQVQIGISRSLQMDLTGCIYAPVDEKGSYPAQTGKVGGFHKIGEWNHLRVIMNGKRIQTFLNGEPFVDYKAVNIPDEGPVGLQLHGGVHMKVEFRDITLRELAD